MQNINILLQIDIYLISNVLTRICEALLAYVVFIRSRISIG